MQLLVLIFGTIYIVPMIIGWATTIYLIRKKHWRLDYLAVGVLGFILSLFYSPLYILGQIGDTYSITAILQMIIYFLVPMGGIGVVVGTVVSWFLKPSSDSYPKRLGYYAVLSTLTQFIFMGIVQTMQLL